MGRDFGPLAALLSGAGFPVTVGRRLMLPMVRSAPMKQNAKPRRSSHELTDHEEIRQWAEERDAVPSCVKGTGGAGDTGMIRLDFPGYSGEESLQEISWDDWFEKFDESDLALLVQEKTADGKTSNFNKLVKRSEAA
jgi:hypothetical protein